MVVAVEGYLPTYKLDGHRTSLVAVAVATVVAAAAALAAAP